MTVLLQRNYRRAFRAVLGQVCYNNPMNKDAIVGFVVLIVVLGGIVTYTALHPSGAQAPTTTLPEAGQYTEQAEYYVLAVNYPTTTPLTALGGKADANAVALMQAFVENTVTQFKTDGNFDNLTAEDISMLGFDQGRKHAIEIKYLISSSPKTLSYIYTIYLDTGGAHPNGFFRTFTFNTTTGANLAIGDLFASGSDYLGTLSTLARAKLPEIIGEGANTEYIESGTTPEENTFRNFLLDNADLVILFDPYQVGPWAIGPQTLRIPLAELSPILNANYR